MTDRRDGWLILTASAFNQMDQYTNTPTTTQNSPFSFLAMAVTITSTHCACSRRDGQAELAWVAGDNSEMLPARRLSLIPLLTGLSVEQLCWWETIIGQTAAPGSINWLSSARLSADVKARWRHMYSKQSRSRTSLNQPTRAGPIKL